MMSPRALLAVVAAAGLSACSDYSFNYQTPVTGGECFDRLFPGEDIDQDPTCYTLESSVLIPNVIIWNRKTFDFQPDSTRVTMTPIVIPLNDDDIPDVVAVTFREDNGVLRAMSGDDGASLWDTDEVLLDPEAGLAGGDLDGDGDVEIIGITNDSRVVAFDNQGRLLWRTDIYSQHMKGVADAPSIADMDGDGFAEVMVGRLILDKDGNTLMEGSYGRGGPSGTVSFAVDIDADGVQELITGNAAYRLDGSVLFYNEEIDGYPAVADFDGDGQAEIVVSGGGEVRLQETDGSVVWRVSLSGQQQSGPPLLIDTDGDGVSEIGVVSEDHYTMLDAVGEILWQETIHDASGNTASTAFDFEGDGLPEVIYGDESNLWIFSGHDGTYRIGSNEHSSRTAIEYPLIVDVDNDGEAEIVAVSSPDSGVNEGIMVFESIDTEWPTARKIWNQHAYSVTNVNDDGSIPAVPELNWRSFNSFRAAHLSVTSGLSKADLFVEIADVCTQACTDDMMGVWVQVGNQGLYSIKGGVELTIYGVKQDGSYKKMETVILEDGLAAGDLSDAIRIDVDGHKALDIVTLAVGVDGGNGIESGGKWAECDEENNEVEWSGSICE
jgi:hypothetical protein